MAAGKEIMFIINKIQVLQYPIAQYLIRKEEKHTRQEPLTVVEHHPSYSTYLFGIDLKFY